MSQALDKQFDAKQGRLPAGSYPAMLTSFGDDGSFDWDGVDRLTDYCIEKGAAGIFACGLSAEIREMEDDEKATLAEHIVRHTAGRVPVVAGAISEGPVEAQAELIQRVHDAGADVVAIAVCQLAKQEEDEQTWIEHADKLLEKISPKIQLSMYECPQPYHRLLSDEALAWAAKSGRFCFMKDTCCNIETILRRLEIVRDSPLQLLNANTATLLASLQAGMDGFCGIGANYMPELYAWLCEHFADQPEEAARLQDYLTQTVAVTENEFYPASAKNYLQQQGLAIGSFSRKLPEGVSDLCVEQLSEMRTSEMQWQQQLLG